MSPRRWALALGLALAGSAATASAGPTLINSRPVSDPATHDLTFFAGGVSENGRSLKAEAFEVLLDGAQAELAVAPVALSDFAATSAESNAAWRPPLAIGVTYLWVDGVPAGLLEGLHSFFQRVPSRTSVYPTIYGRLRQGRARLSAADIGRLDELPYLDAYRPNVLEAVSLDVPDLAADEAPLKVLLLVTDGRDFADPKGEGPGDFAALGRRLRAAGITPLVVGFPPRDPSDASQASANLRDLRDAAGGFLRVLEQPDDLENTLESLGQALADLKRVQVATPLGWRFLGGSHRVTVRMSADGQRLSAEVGTVSAAAGLSAILIVVLAAAAAGLVAAFVVLLRRRRGPARVDDDDDEEEVDEEAIVGAAHDLIRRGVSPQRAVEELSRGRGSAVRVLVDLDPEILNDPRFPYFRTRPGRLRVKEIQDILSKKASARPALGATLAGMLAQAISDGTASDVAAETLAARVPSDEATAFASMKLDELAQAMREAARAQPSNAILATPRARGAAVSIQDALRAEGGAARGIAVAWLVRAAGPGRRGETLRLPGSRLVIGSGARCAVCVQGDPTVADEHAEIVSSGGEFVVAPLGGALSIEGKPLRGRHTLSDGEALEIGAGVYVFKSARSGNLTATDGRGLAAPRARCAAQRTPHE